MRRSMHSLGNSLIRHAAGWLASFLAVAISLVGRSGEAAEPQNSSLRRASAFDLGESIETQVTYVQLGYKDGEDWPPPRPE